MPRAGIHGPRIRWNPTEGKAVIDEAIRLRNANGSYTMQEAMAVLPENRRRSDGAGALRAWFREQLKLRLGSEGERIARAAQPETTKRRYPAERAGAVHWLDDEWRKVIDEGIRLLATAQPHDFAIAQQVLAPDRRRPVNSKTCSEYGKRLKALRMQQMEGDAPPPVLTPPTLPPPSAYQATQSLPSATKDKGNGHGVALLLAQAWDQRNPLPPREEHGPVSALEVIERELVEMGARVLTGILTHGDVRAALAALLQQREVAPPARAEVEFDSSTPTKTTLPRVLVAGLKGGQVEVMKHEFKDRLSLKFWRAGESIHLLKAQSKEAQYVIGMTEWISHPHEQCMRAAAKERYTRYGQSGMSGLKELLAQIAEGQKPSMH